MKKHWKRLLAVVALCLCVALWPGKAYAETTPELYFELNADGTAYTVTGGTNLEGEIVIPAEYDGLPVTEIRSAAFQWYYSRITSVVIPDSVTKIGDSAFEQCRGLTEISLPDSVTAIGDRAFSGTAITTMIIPNSVTEIGEYAFAGCEQLTEIKLPDSVTAIGECVFAGTAITTMIIPDSVTEIGKYAFAWCEQLTELVIPQNVRYINGSVFCGCTALENVQMEEGNAYYTTGSDGALYSKDMTRLEWQCH